MKIPPFKELNPPDSLGYWTNKKTGEKYGGQYISPLLIPNLKKVEAGFKKAMKNKKFEEYRSLDFYNLSKDIIKFWKKNQVFEKSIKTRDSKNIFSYTTYFIYICNF